LRPLTVAGTWASAPIHAASPVGDPRLFVVERGGVVRIMLDGVLQSPAFLTVPNVDTSGERGLLSIAFPIDYAVSGTFYVFASIAGTPARSRVIEYRVDQDDPNLADPTSARVVLSQDLGSSGNHNGGQLVFGGDRKLYLTLGDNTDRNQAQSLSSLLGKVLRIEPTDPDGAGPRTFAVPADNPFAGSPVWALGLRNPWRAAFDDRGRLIVADVGEGSVEEINIGAAGANYGWPLCEGACTTPGMTNPFHSYPHTGTGPTTRGPRGAVPLRRLLPGRRPHGRPGAGRPGCAHRDDQPGEDQWARRFRGGRPRMRLRDRQRHRLADRRGPDRSGGVRTGQLRARLRVSAAASRGANADPDARAAIPDDAALTLALRRWRRRRDRFAQPGANDDR
jgi:hypothetical protein